MARIESLAPARAPWWVRLLFWVAKRKYKGNVPEGIGILAHNPKVLFASAMLELGMERCDAVPARIRKLAELRAATLVGCPF